MKLTIKFGIIAAVALLALAALNGTGCKQSSTPSTPAGQATNTASQTLQYTCPMHPEVVQDKPGKCPKCGMDLVVKK
jgi:Cu(I)/Ag(I) efflux system membrane fusion protein